METLNNTSFLMRQRQWIQNFSTIKTKNRTIVFLLCFFYYICTLLYNISDNEFIFK